MLRRVLLGLGCCLVALGVVLVAALRSPAPLALVCNGLVIVLAVQFERFRYKHDVTAVPGPGWEPTNEKTADAGGVVSVWFNPASGDRVYVRAPRGK